MSGIVQNWVYARSDSAPMGLRRMGKISRVTEPKIDLDEKKPEKKAEKRSRVKGPQLSGAMGGSFRALGC